LRVRFLPVLPHAHLRREPKQVFGENMKLANVSRFFRDVRSEMKSVSWPNRDDLKEGTLVVIVMSAIVAVFLSMVDFGFSKILELLF
jgi:preprotein translocase subunit SecE